MGRALSIVERTGKTCHLGRHGSLISQNLLALAVGSMSNMVYCNADYHIIKCLNSVLYENKL